MRAQMVREGLNVVVRGLFNPAIFHPSWFSAQGLIREQEAQAAQIELVHPAAALFSAEWLQVRVTVDRMQFSTSQESYYEVLRDLVAGTLGLLASTPLSAIGLNRDFHFQLDSQETWHAIGRRLAPKSDWEGLLNSPGLLSVEVQGARTDAIDGYVRVKVAPSGMFHPAVYIEVNDHYQISSALPLSNGVSKTVTILSERWSESMDRAQVIADKIAGLSE